MAPSKDMSTRPAMTRSPLCTHHGAFVVALATTEMAFESLWLGWPDV